MQRTLVRLDTLLGFFGWGVCRLIFYPQTTTERAHGSGTPDTRATACYRHSDHYYHAPSCPPAPAPLPREPIPATAAALPTSAVRVGAEPYATTCPATATTAAPHGRGATGAAGDAAGDIVDDMSRGVAPEAGALRETAMRRSLPEAIAAPRVRGDRSLYNPNPVGDPSQEESPRVLSRAEHPISRKNIDESAIKVLYRPHRSGKKGYLVGGGVRDLMLSGRPKDFDVATDALPREVKRLFRNSRIIGRRFRLVHVFFQNETVEVSTFRRDPDREAQRGGPEDLLITDDNVFGTPREDAFRRDFTVNALFYDIGDFTVIDYVGGIEDLEARLIRAIGDPDVRFPEDPVRMLRACELAARLQFGIESELRRRPGAAAARSRRRRRRGSPRRSCRSSSAGTAARRCNGCSTSLSVPLEILWLPEVQIPV